MSTKYSYKDAYLQWLLSMVDPNAEITISRDETNRTIDITIKI